MDHGRPVAGGPVRLAVDAPEQAGRPGRLLHPAGVHLGHGAGEQPARLHQLGGHDPVVGLATQPRAGPDGKAGAARPRVLAPPLVPAAHVGQQPHQQGAVDGVGVGGVRAAAQGHDGRGHVPVGDGGRLGARLQGVAGGPDGAGGGQLHGGRVQAQGAGHLPQLGVDVKPLTHPQVVDELGAAHAPEGASGQLPGLGAQVAPQVEVGQEVAGGVGEAPVQGVGGLLPVHGPLAHVLDGQGRHHHQDLPGAAALPGLQQHAPQARVNGQTRQASADRRQARAPPRGGAAAGAVTGAVAGTVTGIVAGAVVPGGLVPWAGAVVPGVAALGLNGPDLGEQLDAAAHLAGVGGVQEGEVLHRPQAQGRHLQDDGRQGGAQDLRLGVLRAGVEVGAGVQADGDAVGHAPAATRPLVGAGPADRLNGQALDLGAVGVAGDTRQARVDDVADARDRQGGLGHVGGQDNAAARVRLEDPVLLSSAQARVQGDDLHRPGGAGAPVGGVAGAQVVGQGRLGVTDVPLTGQEDEDVAATRPHELVDGVEDPGDLVAGLTGVTGACPPPGARLAPGLPPAAGSPSPRGGGGAGGGAGGLAPGPGGGADGRVG